MTTDKIKIIRYIYLYLVTAITIIMIIISTIGFIRLALNEWVFKVKTWEEVNAGYNGECGYAYLRDIEKPVVAPAPETTTATTLTPEEKAKCIADAEERAKNNHSNDTKRELVEWIAMLVVAFPLYLYHWGIIKKESKKK